MMEIAGQNMSELVGGDLVRDNIAQQPDKGDVMAFRAIFHDAAVAKPESSPSIPEGPSMSEAILDGVRHLSDSHDSRISQLHETMKTAEIDGAMTMADALKLQFQVTQVALQHQLTSTIAGKSAEGVKTLFRNQ